jgi:hypothetical protein
MSISNFAEDAILNAIFNNDSLAIADRYLKLHTGDPGETGAANAAGETTRQSITGAAAVAGTFTSVNDLAWVNVAATETYTHATIWNDATAGDCLWVGAFGTPRSVTAGDSFTIPAGSMIVSLD